MRAAIVFVLALGAACAAPRAASVTPPPPPPPPPPPVVAAEAAAPASEIEARQILASAFRDAGLRILVDVPIEGPGATLTIDGFDPERGIGYEYVAATERGTGPGDADRRALSSRGLRLLVVAAAPADQIAERAAAFLAVIPPAAQP